MIRVAVVGAVPPEAEGTGSRMAAALLDALVAHDAHAWSVLLGDDDAVTHALAHADAIVLVESRPVHAELARIARLAQGRLVLVPPGYAFCEIATRTCERCPLRQSCPASDRVAVYRELAAAAALVVYASPLHRTASEAFVGAYPERTVVIPPPGIPALADAAITADAVAFAGGDPLEWTNLAGWAAANPERALAIHGVPPPGCALPANVTVRPPCGARAQAAVLAASRALVALPAQPVPFGIAAAAARCSGRELIANDALGLTSRGDAAPGELDAAVAGAAGALADAVGAVARAPAVPRRAPPALGRVLLYAHHVGLGDSVNLWSIARALLDAGATVTFAVPDAHHALLADQLPGGRVVRETQLAIETVRADYDLVVEITIRPGDAFAGDLIEDRWLQLSLERQPSGLSPMHEQFLALFARAGHALIPRRPTIALPSDELARGRAAIVTGGIDVDRELVVAIHPGAGNPGKRWAPERFGTLAQRMRGRGARIVVVGGVGEDALVDALAEHADLVSRAAPLREVAALLAAASIVVANDSGLMHVASAVGVPTLGIFGPTSERLWGPTHPYAAAVRARGTDPRTALVALGVDEVERAFVALAQRVAGEPPLAPGRRIVPSPKATRIATADAVEWRGRAIVNLTGDDPIAPIVEACRAAPAWSELLARHDTQLLATLLAAEIIVPAWAPGVLA